MTTETEQETKPENTTIDENPVEARDENATEEMTLSNAELISIKDALPEVLYILPIANRPFFSTSNHSIDCGD
jgi:hypothetical protein